MTCHALCNAFDRFKFCAILRSQRFFCKIFESENFIKFWQPRILSSLKFPPAMDQIRTSLQLLALRQVLLTIGFEVEELKHVRSEKEALSKIKALMWRKLRHELAPLLPKGMEWDSVIESLDHLDKMESFGDLFAMIHSAEDFWKDLVLEVAVGVLLHVPLASPHLQYLQPFQDRLLQSDPDEVKSILRHLTPAKVKAAINDPPAFFKSLSSQNGLVAQKWVVLQLKQVLQQEGLFKKNSLKQLEPLLMQVDVQDLREGLQEPRKLLDLVKQKGATFAFRLASEQLRARFEDDLPEGITWEEVEEGFMESNLAELETLQKPEDFLKRLVKGTGPLAIKFAIAKGKPELERYLPRQVAWSDVQDVLMEYFSIEAEEAWEKIADPHNLLQSISSDQHVGKKWMLALVRSSLEHLTNIPWNEVLLVLEELELAELSKISKDPAGQALSVVAVAVFNSTI